jgi:predicted porin
MTSRFNSAVLAGIACAGLCAAPVRAQSGPQLYGLVDMWAGRSATSAGGPALAAVNSGGMQTSYWGIGGSEALGHGMTAVYAVEGYLQLDTGAAGRTLTDAMFSRNAYVGLQSPLGELKLGRILNPLFVATALSNPFGGSIRFAPLLAQVWGPSTGRAVSGDTSWDNAVSYTTPAAKGFRLAAYAGLGETAPGAATRNGGATLSYAAGPATAFLSGQRVRVGPGLAAVGQSEQTTWFAGGSYEAGPARLFASWDRADSRGPAIRARTAQAGVALAAGPGSVLLSFARTDNSVAGMADSMRYSRRDTGAAGYDVFLSRRTDLYLVLQHDRLSTANPARTYALGMRHKF